MFATEHLLAIGIVGFYLYDSAKLCFYNELYIEKGFRQKFHFQTLSNQFSLSKKFLMLPNPLCPQYLCFKTRWQIKTLALEPAELEHDVTNIKQISRILQPLQYNIFFNALLTLVLLPMALLLNLGYLLLAILIISIYTLNLFNICWIFFQRKSLTLSKSKMLHLIGDALFCPPFALNLLQKISLYSEFKSDAISLSQQLLPPVRFQQLLEQIIDDLELLKNAAEIHSEQFQLFELKQNELNHLLQTHQLAHPELSTHF